MSNTSRIKAMTEEKYMSKRQLLYFEEKLKSERRELAVQIKNIRRALQTTTINHPDLFDAAQSIAGIGYEVKDLERRRLRMQLIDQALVRIDSGEYGFCVVSGDEIGLNRLEIEPTASMSVEIQEVIEKRQMGNKAKHPSREGYLSVMLLEGNSLRQSTG